MPTPMILLSNINVQHKRVLVRLDLNVPMQNGAILNDARLRAALPTLKLLIHQQAQVMVLSHLGRPDEGKYDSQFSLESIATRLSQLLDYPVRFCRDWINGIDVSPAEIVLCENVRFLPGENADNQDLSRKMAKLCDIFVMDAFATAHRAQASTHGVIRFAPIACAGPLLAGEIHALDKALQNPKSPVVAIIGGSKLSTKLPVLAALAQQVDHLIVGGGIANTFIAAKQLPVGKSLYEPDFIPQAQELLAKKRRLLTHRPEGSAHIADLIDVVVAKEMSHQATGTIKMLNTVAPDDLILDIGPQTQAAYQKLLQKAGTIIWNGPVGVFEIPAFAAGTEAIAHAIAESDAYSLVGGGETLAAIEKFGVADRMSYVSTGGGAFLEFLEGQQLPSLVALSERALMN